ncbi:MAG TPA: HIT family protein [Dehalococcoidales bacterium]
MSFHTDYAKWVRSCKKEFCPVCNREPAPQGMEDLYELPHSWLDTTPTECLKGTCHVVAKKHAVELYELNDAEMLGLMKDIQLYAKALKSVTGAIHINYEIHGNTAPHLHIHVYPRYMDDPFPGKPIDFNYRYFYETGEYEEFMKKMRAELDRLVSSETKK